jgi:hypothetical protein
MARQNLGIALPKGADRYFLLDPSLFASRGGKPKNLVEDVPGTRLSMAEVEENPLEALRQFVNRGRRNPTPAFLEEMALAQAAEADPRIAAVLQEFEDADLARRQEQQMLQKGLQRQGTLAYKDVTSLEESLLADSFDDVKDPKVKALLREQLREEFEYANQSVREIPRPGMESPYKRADSPSEALTASGAGRGPMGEELTRASRAKRAATIDFRSGGERFVLTPTDEPGFFKLTRWNKAGNVRDFSTKKFTQAQIDDLAKAFGVDAAFLKGRLSPDGTSMRMKASGLFKATGGDQPMVLEERFRSALMPGKTTRKKRKERLQEAATRRIGVSPEKAVERAGGRTDLGRERVREATIPLYQRQVAEVDAPPTPKVGGKPLTKGSVKGVGTSTKALRELAKKLTKSGGPMALLAFALLAGLGGGAALMGSNRESA